MSAGMKYDRVLEEMKISLERLKMNSVDILYLHAPDHNTPIKETLSACQKLYEEGKFKELGLSNYASWQVAEVYYICKENGWVLPTVYQGMYNAVTRMVEQELFPCLRNFGIRFYAYNPLAGGILTGKLTYEEKNDPSKEGRFYGTGKWVAAYQDRYWRKSIFDGVKLVQAALDEAYGSNKVSLISAAFRWMNYHSAMKKECNDGIILGGSSLEHITANIDYCNEGPLDERVVKAFDQAWQMDKDSCSLYYR
jgi:aflatoxin B1 aldehyde reductase